MDSFFLQIQGSGRLVFTDAFTPGWIPSGKPFMTAEVTLQEVEGNKTLYTARAMHWTEADRKAHEAKIARLEDEIRTLRGKAVALNDDASLTIEDQEGVLHQVSTADVGVFGK